MSAHTSPPSTPRPERRVRVLLDRAVSASAGLVALSALGVSLYQAILSRQQQRMSVWPYVMQYNSFPEGRYQRLVQNAGLGPALVGGFEVLVDGKPQRRWNDVVRALTGVGDSTLTYGSLPSGTVLLPGVTHQLLELRAGPTATAVYRGVNRDRLRTRVCFCSLYRDCWIADSEARTPTPVRACEAAMDSTRAFEQ